MDMSLALNTVWVMVSAVLVFIMHAGFACVEAGFTQSKNSANIIMKNFMTVAIGTVSYYAVGYSLMYGADVGGLGIIGWGKFGIQPGSQPNSLPLDAFWFFQAVFAATCATIVSGAMAERTKFYVYLFFCFLMCSLVYPMIGHWIWSGDGWLAPLGFHDFAGSTAVHAVGGASAMIGALLAGARAGKYTSRKIPNRIPAHSIPLGALGVLLLWFGWFGFNCGSTLRVDPEAIGRIAVNTILAGSSAALCVLLFTKIRTGKTDVSLTLNGCLAGLVGVTAGCDSVTPFGALCIGALCSLAMLLAVNFFDRIVRIDDPVGAISVHGVCGALGTILVGFFSVSDGLLYAGGWRAAGVQALGVLCCAGASSVFSLAYFLAARKTVGIRVPRRDETSGLDQAEHDVSAYCGLIGM